jgi:hypothetical protein
VRDPQRTNRLSNGALTGSPTALKRLSNGS